jgi:membrane protease YdiL (CAAX protease family)
LWSILSGYLAGSEPEMTSTNEEQYSHGPFSMTRMIYAVCGAIILYKLLEFGGWSVLKKAQNIPWGLYRFDLWFHAINLAFVLAMLAVGLAYRPKAELFRWSSPRPTVGASRSIGLGLAGGVVALALASPIFWIGDKQLESVRSLIAHAFSPLRVIDLVVFIVALAVSSEMVYRGVMFRTLAGYATVPAAILGSGLLFAYVYPVLSFYAAIILGIASAILYYRTRNLLAPTIANALFTVGGGALTLYRGLHH